MALDFQKPLRIAFMGTPNYVVPVLKMLRESQHDLVCVYTQPPRESGRQRKIAKKLLGCSMQIGQSEHE